MEKHMIICMAIDKRTVLPMRAGRRSATVTETYASHARALSRKQADRQTNRETDTHTHHSIAPNPIGDPVKKL